VLHQQRDLIFNEGWATEAELTVMQHAVLA
jgi:hypothetical protein